MRKVTLTFRKTEELLPESNRMVLGMLLKFSPTDPESFLTGFEKSSRFSAVQVRGCDDWTDRYGNDATPPDEWAYLDEAGL